MALTNRAIIYLEERFLRSDEGKCASSVFNNAFWDRYLSVYDQIHVVARIEHVREFDLAVRGHIITNDKIYFHEVPFYKGPLQFLYGVIPFFVFMLNVSRLDGVSILRLPGVIGGFAFILLSLKKRKYGIELVGDPNSVFSSGVGGLLSSVYKHVFTFLTRLACRRAAAVAYVTKSVMQDAYPAASGAFTTYYSSIQLPSELIVDSREIKSCADGHPFTILMVGSMEQRYKGFDVMIKALQLLRSNGRDVIVKIAGSGSYQCELERLVAQLGLSSHVIFLGMVSRSCVLSLMDEAEFFVMPSRTEGLPRALIEAMARGLPAIGSNVGGIPELLDQKFLFESEDFTQLAVMIDEFIDDSEVLLSMSRSNISIAREYETSVLRARQYDFYKYLLNASG